MDTFTLASFFLFFSSFCCAVFTSPHPVKKNLMLVPAILVRPPVMRIVQFCFQLKEQCNSVHRCGASVNSQDLSVIVHFEVG